MRSTYKVTIFIILGCFQFTASADNWTRFRGPDGSGVVNLPGLPTQFGESDFLWSVPTNGNGHSSPVIFGKKLFYTITPESKPETREVVCVSTEDGKELWRSPFQFSKYKIHRFNSFASTSPAVDKDRVYIWWSDNDDSAVMALSHDGKRLWREKLGGFKSQHGSGSSLVVLDGVLLVQKENLGDSSFIAGLAADSGKELWKHELSTSSKTPYGTPTIRSGADGKPEAVFVSKDHGLFALNPTNGKVNWKFDTQLKLRTVASPVLIGNDHFFVCSGSGGGARGCFTVKAAAGQESSMAYEVSKRGPYVPTGIGYKDLLLLVSDGGIATCRDGKTGEQHWQKRLMKDCYSSLVCVNGNIYAFGLTGEYKVFKAAKTFQLIGEGEVGAPVNATPAIADGKMFIRTRESLLCLPAKP